MKSEHQLNETTNDCNVISKFRDQIFTKMYQIGKIVPKAIFLLILITGFGIHIHAQDHKKLNLGLYSQIHSEGNSTMLINLLAQADISQLESFLKINGGFIKYNYGDIASIMIPANKILELTEKEWLMRIESNMKTYQPMNDTMRSINYVNAIHSGQAPLNSPLKGNGVVVGIIDTGVDFDHPDLQDSLGQTRILHLWDQNQPLGANTPQPYNYGQEWNNTQIDFGAANIHTDIPYSGHGTHVTGIAAGNALANGTNRGVAPEADIIEVAFNFNDVNHFNYADAVNYIFTKASAAGKPCVINASLGDYYGSHDGTDLESQMISNMLDQQPGRVLVGAAGNAGTIQFHLGYQVTSDTNWTWLLHNVNFPSLYFQVWADTADFKGIDFAIGADANKTAASFAGNIPFSDIFDHLGVFKADTLYGTSGNRIAVVQSFGSLQGPNYLMEFVIEPDSASYSWRWMTTGTGKFDIWKFLDGTGQSGFYTGTLPPASQVPSVAYYKLPDENQTIVSGFQCLDNVIAVGNFGNRAEYIDVNGNLYSNPTVVPGEISASSSWGPTRDGRIKPDITASGGIMLSCGEQSLLNIWAGSAQADKVAQGGKHFRDGGTSSAAPVVAGIAALYLEKYPNAYAADVKAAILQCAVSDSFTGPNLPDNVYGYGKVDGFGTIVNCGFTGMETFISGDKFTVYPNPVSVGETFTVDISEGTDILVLYNAIGEMIRSVNVGGRRQVMYMNTEGLAPGIYFISSYKGGQQAGTMKLGVISQH
jgi:subtilisin family serine protease